MEIIFTSNGQGRCVYAESIDVAALGQVSIRRASYVEPTLNGQWQADMAPVSGPLLGPFERRSDALETERLWLAANWLTTGRNKGVQGDV